MQPAARYGARSALFGQRALFRHFVAAYNQLGGATQPWRCRECRLWEKAFFAREFGRRQISFSAIRLQDEKSRTHLPTDSTGPAASSPEDAPRIAASTSASLPSHTEKKRWDVSKRTATLLDKFLAQASIASHYINNYTGTDYSGIEVLRTEITGKEAETKLLHKAVENARSQYSESFTSQAAAQKEIVSLLERKSSWSPTDLERYMSLVRSEHLNDQAVQTAKENLAAAERDLEDTRSLLERLERKQYHEEQIWSDTIRRNSTWVTMGLMGVNILLLLAQISIFEPYRRRKIVKQVKEALDERNVGSPATVLAVDGGEEVEKQIDQVVPRAVTTEALDVSVQQVDQPAIQSQEPLILEKKEAAGQTLLAAGEHLPEETAHVADTAAPSPRESQPPLKAESPATTLEAYRETFRDLFSERSVRLKKVEVTTVALQGAASGVAVMGLLFVLLRPK